MAPLYVQCNSEESEAEARYAPQNAEIQPNPDYANTRTNMKGSRDGGRRGRKKGFFGRRRLQKKGRQRASRKKSPISRMKRGEERERERREKFPFCLSSFTAFTPRRGVALSSPQSFSRTTLKFSRLFRRRKNCASRTHFFSQQARTAQNQSLNPETSGNLNT